MDPHAGARLAWIDAAKGFGLVTVVAGHVLDSQLATHVLYLFHMPFFFALSGLTFKSAPLGAFALRRARALLVPYLAYLALIAVATGSRPDASFVLGGVWLEDDFVVFWFVSALFVALCAFDVIVLASRSGAAGAAALLASAAVAVPLLPLPRLPLALDAVPAATAFVAAGWLYARADAAWRGSTRLLARASIAYLAGFAVWFAACWPDVWYFNLRIGRLGPPVIGFATALAASVVLFETVGAVASAGCRPARFATRAFGSLGQAGLAVVFLHQPVHLALARAGFGDQWILLGIGLGLPWAASLAIRKVKPLRMALLGASA